MTQCSTYGFRVVGTPFEDRKLINWSAAFQAYASCDERAKANQPAYLSAFQFGDEFKCYMQANGTTKGYIGSCWSQWLWFDIDNEQSSEAALRDTRRLVEFLAERYAIDDELLVWFSGNKGYHIGVPTSLWQPESSPFFARNCRLLAETLAQQCGVLIDSSVYDRVRLFRAPNSRHAKTGLFKRRLDLNELLHLDVIGIRNLAAEPMPFDIPTDPPVHAQAVSDWQAVAATATASQVVCATGTTPVRLNRSTREFLLNGADEGDRHRLLYSSARNLGEFDCSFDLAFALLEPVARESGLPPSDIRRQIDCGLRDQIGGAT